MPDKPNVIPFPKEIHLHLTMEELYALAALLDNPLEHEQRAKASPDYSRRLLDIYRNVRELRSRLPRRQHAPEGECKICDAHRQRLTEMCPSHDASHHCESGKRPHCTCDWCF